MRHAGACRAERRALLAIRLVAAFDIITFGHQTRRVRHDEHRREDKDYAPHGSANLAGLQPADYPLHSFRMPARSPLTVGVFLAVLAAIAFGVTTPVVAWAGASVGSFTTAALLYAGAALASVVRVRSADARGFIHRKGDRKMSAASTAQSPSTIEASCSRAAASSLVPSVSRRSASARAWAA